MAVEMQFLSFGKKVGSSPSDESKGIPAPIREFEEKNVCMTCAPFSQEVL